GPTGVSRSGRTFSNATLTARRRPVPTAYPRATITSSVCTTLRRLRGCVLSRLWSATITPRARPTELTTRLYRWLAMTAKPV
ncbi:hypothetical protein GGF43_006954, partial [Coemansia sp. RSA 2618]